MTVDKSQRTTLNVTREFKEELDKMRLANESYEEILRREIRGYKRSLLNVNEPIAFQLSGRYNNAPEETISVSWS